MRPCARTSRRRNSDEHGGGGSFRARDRNRILPAMSEQIVARAITAHRGTLQALDGRLEAPDAADQKDALKEEIISFFKVIEQEIADLNPLKADAKKLVDTWKKLHAAQAPAP